MDVSPWPVLLGITALANLAAFVAIRGRWDRLVPLLAILAAGGAAAGDAAGRITGLEPMRTGDFHLVAASIGAQLAMLVTSLVAAAIAPPHRPE